MDQFTATISSSAEEIRNATFRPSETGWIKTIPLQTYAAVVAGPKPSPKKTGISEAAQTTKQEGKKGKVVCPNVTKKMMGIISKRGVTYNLTRKQMGRKNTIKKVKSSAKAKSTLSSAVDQSRLNLSTQSSETSQKSQVTIVLSRHGSITTPPVTINVTSPTTDNNQNETAQVSITTTRESSVPNRPSSPTIIQKTKSKSPTESSIPTHDVIEMVQWLLEPEISKEPTTSTKTSSLGTLNKRIECNAEPLTTLAAPKNPLVQDWLDKYVVCPPATITEANIESATITNDSNMRKNTAVCPICLIPVPKISEHLKRKCMSDSKGYTNEQRKEKMEEVYKRQNISRIAVVKSSELLQAYEEKTKVEYIHYLTNLLESIGISTVRDHVFTDNLPFESFPLTARLEPSLAYDNISLELDLESNVMEQPITSTPLKQVSTPQPAHPKLQVTTPAGRAIFNAEPASPVMPPPTPTTVSSKTPQTPLDSLTGGAAAAFTPNDASTSLIPSRHLSPIVLLQRMPVKRKLENDIGITSSAKKAKSMSDSSSSTLLVSGYRYTKQNKLQMSRLGFYGKFEMHEASILLKYDAHLKDTMAMSDTKYREQQVANVNRVLYKLCPAFCNPETLIQTEAIKDYFNSLPSILADSTKINYVKSLLIFLSYCSQTSTVRLKYPKLIDSLPFIKDCLHSIRAGCAKRSTRKTAERRAAQFRGDSTTYPITDILNSVNVLKKKYLKYLKDTKITHLKLKSLNTYFVALISLKNAQRPAVFSNLQLREFEKPVQTVTSNGARMNVAVVEHKTASTQLATVSFTDAEYEEIKTYIKDIRPQLATDTSPESVFLNRKGEKIINPTQYLSDRQKELDLPRISPTDARHSFETSSAALLKPKQRSALATYLAHSLATADAHYVDINEEQIQHMSKAISILQQPISVVKQSTTPSSPTAASGNHPTVATSSSSNSPLQYIQCRSSRQPVQDHKDAQPSSSSPVSSLDLLSNKKYYTQLYSHFPIVAEEQLPTASDIKVYAEETLGCNSFSASDVKRVRAHFDYQRNQKRSLQTASYFPGTRPSSNDLIRQLKKKGWYNKDTFLMAGRQWIPFPSPLDIQRLKNCLLSKINRQKWHSCALNDGVLVAKQHILPGEIVCDYHANVLTHEKGLALYDNSKDSTYRQNMYFSSYLDHKYWFDGNKPCTCHNMTSKQLKGRHVTHSINGYNLMLTLYYLNDQPHLLFEAIHRIPKGRVLQFDRSAAIKPKILS